MENFLYECIYDVLRNTYPHGQKMIMLNLLKANYPTRKNVQQVMLDNGESNR